MALQRTDTLYAKVCEISINHDYYLTRWKFRKRGSKNLVQDNEGDEILASNYNIMKDLAIVPTPETAELMRRLRMQVRASRHGFFLALPVVLDSGNYKPLRPFDDTSIFKFEIRLKNTQFINYSELAIEGLGGAEVVVDNHIEYYSNYYFFTNRAGKYPYLNTVNPLEESTLHADDVRSEQVERINTGALGMIEINAFVKTGDPGNIIEGGNLNIAESGGNWTWPMFEVNVKSRKLYWTFHEYDGTERERSFEPISLTRIQTNPLRLDHDINKLWNRPNPSPENIKWDPGINEYVAQVYLTYYEED